MSPSQLLLLVALSILWGGSFLFVGIAVKELPSLTIVMVRVGLAALLLLPVAWILGVRFPKTLSAWQPFFGMAILNNVIPFTLITMGQREVASGLASTLNATTPLFTLIIAHALTDEKLKANKLAGVVLGIVGIAVLLGPEAIFGRTSSLVGMLLCLGACVSYGFAGYWGQRLRETPAIVSACCQLLCSTLVLATLTSIVDRPWTLAWPSMRTVLALIGLAALSTAIAYVIFFRILAVSGSTNVMLVTLLIPVSGIAFGLLLLDETLLLRHVIGALVIAAGLLVIDGRLFTRPGSGAASPSKATSDPS